MREWVKRSRSPRMVRKKPKLRKAARAGLAAVCRGRRQETPSFRRHVVPLLGKLGCNGRACHGSFQGRGGFRLSLFGYDFKMDHQRSWPAKSRASTAEPRGQPDPAKADAAHPARRGPAIQAGKLGAPRSVAVDSRGRRTASRIRPDSSTGSRSGRPKSASPRRASKSRSGRSPIGPTAPAKTSPRCAATKRNDEQIAKIDTTGVSDLRRAGRFARRRVLRLGRRAGPRDAARLGRRGAAYPGVPTPTEIDRLVVNKLRKLGIVPSDVCSDTEFLRRASLDVTGTLPTADEIAAFLADKTPDKRHKKVDELLERPTYAAWWTTRLCDITGNTDRALANITPVEHAGQPRMVRLDFETRAGRTSPTTRSSEGIVLATSRPATKRTPNIPKR